MMALAASGTELIPLGVLTSLAGRRRARNFGTASRDSDAAPSTYDRVGFFIGLASLVMGVLRNRRQRKSPARS
jgi:hypothetical protein